MMRSLGKTFINAILAGLFIGLAGTVYLCTPNPIAGAFLFAFGLMTIVCYGFKLYTGAIGYLVNQGKNAPSYLLALTAIWLGNLTGCWAVGTLIRHSRSFHLLSSRVAGIADAKLQDCWSSLLILSFFCGILMYLAVETYRRKDDFPPIFRFAAVFLCVAVFILSGFEHCVANMYYFSAAGVWDAETLGAILLMTLGNSLGGWLLPLADKVRQ